MENENKYLNSELHMMKEQLETTKQQLNANAQYMRSSWMLEISGIPTSKDEDSKGIVCKLARLVKTQDFSMDQIDVVHRISSKPAAPIIVLFYKKNDRNNFYEQKGKRRRILSTNTKVTQWKEKFKLEKMRVVTIWLSRAKVLFKKFFRLYRFEL